jgi:hypothetical protein
LFGVGLAPDIKDMKALATALKLHSHFETLDRLARDWIERGMREKKPEDLESDERREWYDMRESWESATERLKKVVNKFQRETGFSPILRYYREVDSMGAVGKVFLGYDSGQAKGYRIIQISYPVWFEDLRLPTEEKSEEEVYRLVPVQRMSDEEERTLRESFVEDLRAAGIERFGEYMPRYESTIDKRRTYNENVFRVEELVKTIIHEHALAVRPPTPIAVAKGRVGERLWASEQSREDAEGDVRTFQSAGLTCRIVPSNGRFEVWCSGEVKTISRPMMPPAPPKPPAPAKVTEPMPEIPSEVKVKVQVEEGGLGEFLTHVLYDSLEVTFAMAESARGLKEYLEGGEDFVDMREMLELQELPPEQVESELKKLPWPFSSGEEIRVVWTMQDVTFTPTAKEWWDTFNKVYLRPELEAFDLERLKTIAKLKGVRIGKDKAETVASILGEVYPPVTAAPPPAPPKPPAPERKGLTTSDISRLQDLWNNTFFRALGRVPPNSASAFRVEVEKVKDKTYSEAQEEVLRVAKDIVDEFLARQVAERGVPARRVEVFRPPPEEEARMPIARIPPAEAPPHPLEPEEMKWPRGPSSREREALWRAFQYRMQEMGYNAFEYEDEFEEYIMGTQFKDWNELLAKFKTFGDAIIEGKALPPLWQWRGMPIPVGLEGVLRKTPAERLQDVIVHFTSVVIRNARTKGVEPTLADLQIELSERGLIPPDMIITPTSPLYGEIKNALTSAYKRKDIWLTGISLEELTRFLET